MQTIFPNQGNYPLTHSFTREAGFGRWTLAMCIAGSMKITTGLGSDMVRAPSLVLIAPNTSYTAAFGGIGKSWREYWVIFDDRSRWHRWLHWPSLIDLKSGIRALALVKSEHQKGIVDAMADAYAYNAMATLNAQAKEDLLDNALERLFLLADQINPVAQRKRPDDRVLQAMEILASPATLHISMEELAGRVHVSTSHLAHLFTQQVGQSPMQFHEQQKLRRAAELLLTTHQSVAQIARTAGYENAFHFSTRFRKWAGASPRQFREGQTDSPVNG